MTGRPWLVGESNPHDDDPRRALDPTPAGTAGARLCALLGVLPEDYVATFNRRNLLPAGRWSAPTARESARSLLAEAGPGARVVLLGARVAAAFGVPFSPPERYVFAVHDAEDQHLLVVPHPSGLSRLWNDADVRARVVAVMRGFVAEVGGDLRSRRSIWCSATPGPASAPRR